MMVIRVKNHYVTYIHKSTFLHKVLSLPLHTPDQLEQHFDGQVLSQATRGRISVSRRSCWCIWLVRSGHLPTVKFHSSFIIIVIYYCSVHVSAGKN